MTTIMDDKIEVNVDCLNFSAAFQTVKHRLHGCKLRGFGVHAKFFSWFNVGSSLSSSTTGTSGVLQGTMIDYLFVLYVSDIPLRSKLPLFADDVKLDSR